MIPTDPQQLLALAQSRPLECGLAAAAAVLLAWALLAQSRLGRARRELAEALEKLNRPAPPPPPRQLELRREHVGLLWFPTLTVKEPERVITGAAAGLPHCLRCVKPLSAAASGEWVCGGCGDKRPPSAADIQVTDALLGEAVREYLSLHPGYRYGGQAPLKGVRQTA